MLEHLGLVRLGDVSVPMPHGNVGLGAQILKTQELVVYQRLERADIDTAHRGGRILPELGKNGEERGLGFSRGGGGGEQDVLIGVENSVCSSDLHGSQALPVVIVDEVLNERCVAVECVHGGLDVELGKLVARGRRLPANRRRR